MTDKEEKVPGQIEPKGFRQKIENFFYHYKWHTVVIVFLLVVIAISTFQMCDKTEYDYTAMYAGPHVISSRDSLIVAQSLDKVAGEGKTCYFYSYYLDIESPTGYTGQTLETFDQEVMSGNAPILLLSPAMFTRLTEGAGALIELDPYISQDSGAVFYSGDHRAVLLSSLDIYTLDGISSLPEDTLLCMRSGVSLANIFSRKQAQQRFEKHELFIRALISYEKQEQPDNP